MAAVFTVLAGLFHHQCCMEFAAGQRRQSGRSFHAALMVQQACQHRSYISQCMGRLGSAYSMKRFDAASPHQGFKTSLLFALKSLAAVLKIFNFIFSATGRSKSKNYFISEGHFNLLYHWTPTSFWRHSHFKKFVPKTTFLSYRIILKYEHKVF